MPTLRSSRRRGSWTDSAGKATAFVLEPSAKRLVAQRSAGVLTAGMCNRAASKPPSRSRGCNASDCCKQKSNLQGRTVLQEAIMCLRLTGFAGSRSVDTKPIPTLVLEGPLPLVIQLLASGRVTPPYNWPRAATLYSYCNPTLRVCVFHIEWVKPISLPPRRTLKIPNPL